MVLSETNVNQVDFEAQWSSLVATQFGLDEATLASIYDYSTDQWNTNMNTRAMWKSACARTVSGTPTVFINGVKLDKTPATVDKWITQLQSVYDSQYHAPTKHQTFAQKMMAEILN